MSQQFEDYIAHFGVKGMKWGVRKNPDGLTRRQRKEQSYSDDYASYKTLKKRKTSTMSNDEMQVLVRRMQLETQYKDLKRRDLGPAANLAKQIVLDSAREVAKDTVKNEMKRGARAGVKYGAEGIKKIRG